MDLATYQSEATTTMIPSDDPLQRLILGLNGEAGEVAEAMKKDLRDDDIDRDDRLRQELGDVLWYAAMIAEEINTDLSRIAEDNLDKLSGRDDAEKIRGDGDDR